MLQVARLSPKLLGDSAALVADFLRGQWNDDGGVKDRAGASDLYYTVFGVDGLLALRADVPSGALLGYLRSFGDGEALDLVHLACLARGWGALPHALRQEAPAERILARLENHRSADGGYHAAPGAERGTLYGCFLGWGAYQDLGRELPGAARLLNCIEQLQTADGGFSNQAVLPIGLTAPTAAAITLLRQLGQPARPALGEWLLAQQALEGGFLAMPGAPLPDLLSTATALHALAGMQVDLQSVKESCLDFVDTLWTNRGGFHGNWGDDELDCEYTYYGLLALGHLSL
jgi:prenyltransferase beta subunit